MIITVELTKNGPKVQINNNKCQLIVPSLYVPLGFPRMLPLSLFLYHPFCSLQQRSHFQHSALSKQVTLVWSYFNSSPLLATGNCSHTLSMSRHSQSMECRHSRLSSILRWKAAGTFVRPNVPFIQHTYTLCKSCILFYSIHTAHGFVKAVNFLFLCYQT